MTESVPFGEGIHSGSSGIIPPIHTEQTPRIVKWARAFQWRLNNHYDAVVVIDGPEGTGKSTLAYHLCRYLDSSFNVDRIGFNTDEVIRISLGLEPGKLVLMDEGVEGLHHREAMRKENKLWMKWMMVSRKKRLGIFICYPKFDALDLYMREFRVWSRINVVRRGMAHIGVRNWNFSPETDGLRQAFPIVATIKYGKIKDKKYLEVMDRKDDMIRELGLKAGLGDLIKQEIFKRCPYCKEEFSVSDEPEQDINCPKCGSSGQAKEYPDVPS